MKRKSQPIALFHSDKTTNMGQVFGNLFDAIFGKNEIRIVMLGLYGAGRTTILYKLQNREDLSTVLTVGFNLEEFQYNNAMYMVWDVGRQGHLERLYKHIFHDTNGLIYVIDSLDREMIGTAKAEFQAIINEPFMTDSIILVFANKQDMKGAMTPIEVSEGLGMNELDNRKWHIQGTCALTGDGLYEGLDWLATTLKDMKASTSYF